MPRETQKTVKDIKPYSRPSPATDSSEADDIKPTPASGKIEKKGHATGTRKSRKDSAALSRAWTNDELTQLFEHVAKNGANGHKVWEGAVAGRTSNQAYQTWLQSLAPFIRKAIGSKPTKGRA